ncbi:EamA-like transporter family protein [Azospirillum baldaniorum]|uniref:DMT family transporter n=1 Tax=Azospirillum baldaniorum TaxID=1064539 RepID=UPI0011A68F60|nr:DMT family transporter [Azospirillum baldaniorum]TWA69620.1 EamA-like transporter family protein [Azospirillum baldaniorum]
MTLPSATVPPASRGAESLALLLLVGGLIGVIFPVTKIAQAAGVPPLPWAFSMMLGAGVILAGLARVKGQAMLPAGPLTGRYLRYFAVSGLLSMALPNVVLFFVMPWLGAGLSAVVYTLPPILTLLMAVAVRIEKPDRGRVLGILLGFVGALMIVGPRGSLPSPDLAGWMALAFVMPLSVAAGNVYRTMAWPPGGQPVALAAGTMLGGAAWVALALLATGAVADLPALGLAPGLALLQIAVTALTYVLYFRLQVVAGPVYLSQIGYVATSVGLGTGTLLFGERYSPWVWGGAAVIVLGVLLVSFGRRFAR